MTKEEFFEGVSVPRNKELMRIYRDLELVEQLGSGVPRIVDKYGKDAIVFLSHFIRMIFRFETLTETVNHENDTVNGENETLKKRIEVVREALPETKEKVFDRYILILKALSNREYRTVDLMEYTSVSRSTIKRDLEVLISIGQVKTEGVGKGLHYKLVTND